MDGERPASRSFLAATRPLAPAPMTQTRTAGIVKRGAARWAAPEGRECPDGYLDFLAVVACLVEAPTLVAAASAIFRWSWSVGRVSEAKVLTSLSLAAFETCWKSLMSFLWSFTISLT